MFYLNTSRFAKTFYGVTFLPGQVKEVPGYINHSKFVLVASMPKEPPASIEKKKKQGRPKKEIIEPEIHEEQEEVLNGATEGDKASDAI